jgi:HK97 gp10 family phage protein
MNLQGHKELIKALKNVPIEVRDKSIASSVRVGAKKVQEKAKALAPVKTGALRDSIAIQKMGKGKIRKFYGFPEDWIVYTIGLKKVEFETTYNGRKQIVKWVPFYGYFIEFGTSKMSPRPFMRPAAELTFPSILSVIKNDLRIKLPKFFLKYTNKTKTKG